MAGIARVVCDSETVKFLVQRITDNYFLRMYGDLFGTTPAEPPTDPEQQAEPLEDRPAEP